MCYGLVTITVKKAQGKGEGWWWKMMGKNLMLSDHDKIVFPI